MDGIIFCVVWYGMVLCGVRVLVMACGPVCFYLFSSTLCVERFYYNICAVVVKFVRESYTPLPSLPSLPLCSSCLHQESAVLAWLFRLQFIYRCHVSDHTMYLTLLYAASKTRSSNSVGTLTPSSGSLAPLPLLPTSFSRTGTMCSLLSLPLLLLRLMVCKGYAGEWLSE